MNITFKAFEYNSDGSFNRSDYAFEGDVNTGWRVLRNDQTHFELGRGYEVLKTRMCGICSTDLDRRFLPFPLPQIIGHEVVCQRVDNGKKCVVEINDTPYYRDEEIEDIFCKSGLHTHTPGRRVLGIDRLPGGFGPYLLAPKNAINDIAGLNEYAAVLVEPLAAALQAVIASPPETGDDVAVLGPRRLGTLLIAALKAFRRTSGRNFKIYALARHKNLLELCHHIGADDGINLADTGDQSLDRVFDIVYDTTGSESGFELALKMAKREVHLKSTNGQKICGLENLTAFVVDELSILPFNDKNIEFTWKNENRKNQTVLLAPGVDRFKIKDKNCYRKDPKEAGSIFEGTDFQNRLPRFDIAVASSILEIDSIIRPDPETENTLIRPRGAILFKGDSLNNQLLEFIIQGGSLRSSRCGDFHLALKLLGDNKDISDNLSHYMISHVFPATEISTAFRYARRSESIKVVVKHSDYTNRLDFG